MKNLTNYHVLTVKYLGATDFKGSRIAIRSDRFKMTKVIDYTYNYGNALEQAQEYLENKGFKLIGKAEGKDCDYIISTTFESIK
jgi:hypothetical protein